MRSVRKGLGMPLIVVLVGMLGFSIASLAAPPSPADCQAVAKRAEMDAGSVTGGVARGAVRGAAFGAIVGDSHKSARRGAAIGGVSRGLRKSAQKNDIYRMTYDSCMAGH